MSGESQTDYLDKINLPEKLQGEIEDMAKEKKLTKDQKEKFEKEVRQAFLKESFEAGEVVGILAAQSISEPATQMTMRTYHFAGSAGVRITYGLPRLIEIFDAKRAPETPVMTVFLKSSANNRESAKKIAEKIIEKTVFDVTKRLSINLEDNLVEIEPLDLKSIEKIAKAITEGLKGAVDVKVKTKKITVKPDSEEITVKELQKIREKIMVIHVDGIKEISNAVVRREGEEWIINTIGTNLSEVLNITDVDENRTVTNDIHETKKILGVEAARNLIISESLQTMQEQGLDIDVRHVMLVADMMTMAGGVKPIGRYGVAGTKASILARAAFEETIKHLVRASVRNESDSFQGIFENVMIGQLIPSGTGMFDLIAKYGEKKPLDEEKK
jgi:DNA-directed RNA polymerase subunit A"